MPELSCKKTDKKESYCKQTNDLQFIFINCYQQYTIKKSAFKKIKCKVYLVKTKTI